MVLIAVAFVAVAIAISHGSGGAPPKPGSPRARADVARVNDMLRGIPESGTTLGSPRAPVTVTEFADLECPYCRDFAAGAERQLIADQVRTGAVKLTYRSLCTATCSGPLGHAAFPAQQAAAYAAGLHGRAWYFIELFYAEQGADGTGYATPYFLDGLARQLSGLNYQAWRTATSSDLQLRSQVRADERAASTAHFSTTPTLVIRGPRGAARPIFGATDYKSLLAAIKGVS